MSSKLMDFISVNSNKLHELNISIDEIKLSELGFKEEAEQVDLFNEMAFTRITLFDSNRVYIHILDIESEETIYFFDDFVDDDVNINDFIMEAIYYMGESKM